MIKYLCLIVIFLKITVYSQGYICAIGGGSEDYSDWSDAPYQWIVQKANNGKIIVLGDADASLWLPTYFISLGADTAYNKTISSIATANLQATYDELITAKAIFIRGGDQWSYIRLWKGTLTEAAINLVFQNGGVVAGTSAGAAVLGEIDFSARNGSVYPNESLINPFNTYMQFEDNFLKLVPNVIFDTHFIARGREARLMAMLYNRHYNASRDLIGVGIDDMTAVGIDTYGVAEVFGSGAASFFIIDNETNFLPFNANIYSFEKLKCHQLTKGWKFDLTNKQISYVPPTAKFVDTSRSWKLPVTDSYITGSSKYSEQLPNNFSVFALNNSNSTFGIISHPGYISKLDSIKQYLNTSQLNYKEILITSSNLNDTAIVNKINSSLCFIFAGDSLNVLSLLKDTSMAAGRVFYNKLLQHPKLFLFGKSGKILSEFYIDNLYKDLYASYKGRMTNNTGLRIFSDLISEPSVYVDTDFYENTISSVLWGMMLNRKRLGIYQNGNSMAFINSTNNSIKGYGTIHPLFVDASQTTLVDSSTYRASGSAGTRQVVAMNNLRYCYTSSNAEYIIKNAQFDFGTNVNESKATTVSGIILNQNYPNPFNPSTTITFEIKKPTNTSLKVYDILGTEIAVLYNGYKQAGFYSILFNSKNLSSGVYFYRITTGDYSETKMMVLLK